MRVLRTLVVALVGMLVVDVASAEEAPVDHRSLIKVNDGILWIGDDLIEASDWPRFVVTGLLQAREDDGVRWSRAGVEGSTARDAAAWSPRLVMTLRVSLVFASFGQAELEQGLASALPTFPEMDDAGALRIDRAFDDSLRALTESLSSRRVRSVVVLSPQAFDEHAPSSRGRFTGFNRVLARMASSAGRFARDGSHPYIDLFRITNDVHQRIRAAGESPTTDGRTPTELASTLIAADVLAALGVTREQLGEVGWRPCTEPVYQAARRIDPTLAALAEGQGSASFGVAQALSVYDAHWEILWRDLDQGLHPDHSHRAEILSMHRAEVDADWRRVRDMLRPAPEAAPAP